MVVQSTGGTVQVERNAWSREEAAASLGLSVKHVDRLVARGEIPVLRVGRRVLFRPSDVNAFVDRCVDA